MWGGGNPLNIIRIGGALEQFDIVLCNDLNGCISNLLINYPYDYSLTWNSTYPNIEARDITQNNVDKRYYCLQTYYINDLHSHLSEKPSFSDKSALGKFRPIIEFRE